MARPLLAVPVVALALFAAGCGSKHITQDEVESKAQAYLDDVAEQQGGTNKAKVSCPDDLNAEVGESMNCTASDETGELTVVVTVDSVGDNVSTLSFKIES